MGAIDNVAKHWTSIAAITKLHVPEWELDVHFTRMNAIERQNMLNAVETEGDFPGTVDTLIAKAKDAEGKQLFTLADRPTLLRKADPDVIASVVLAMRGVIKFADAMGNSDASLTD